MLGTFLLAIISAFTPPARDAQSVLRALEARYHRAQTLKAAFYERYSENGANEGSAESGTVYFSQPGRMRWEYESPETKLFIVDATNVWFYVPADHTVSRAKVKESTDWRTPLALLTGKSDLSKLCRSIEILDPNKSSANAPATAEDSENRPSSPENTILRCVPKRESVDSDQDIREVLLESDPDSHLVRLIIRQPGNLETEFRFANWRENLPIAETMFHFAPPPGATVVDESALANQIH
jgi:outer membrane lipoprotein carrier protein